MWETARVPVRLGLLLMVLAGSSAFIAAAFAVEVLDPVTLLLLRFGIGALVAVPFALVGGRWRGAPLGRLAVVGLLYQVLQFAGVYGGLALGVPAALSALVMLGLSPLVATGLAVAAGHERGDAALWLGLGVGALGVGISLGPELGGAQVGAGIGLTLLGMLGLATGTVLQKDWVGDTDPIVSVAVQSVVAVVVIAPAGAVVDRRFELGPQLVLSTLWIGLVLGVLTLGLIVGLLRRVPASTATGTLLLVPAVTAIASTVVLGEALHPASVLGMVIALAGVGVVLRRHETRAAVPAV